MNTAINEKGSALVFVALSLFVLLSFLGLATDAGVLVFVRSQGQARVDAASLAAAAALVQTNATQRQNTAVTLANTFSDKNSVVNATLDPVNIVEPISYDMTTGTITDAVGWSPGATGLNCNAVRVSTTIPTPVFFSGIRRFFGSTEGASVDIQVGAVGHLPCPGLLYTNTEQEIAPIALRECQWSFPQSCDTNQRLYQESQQIDNSFWITYNLTANAPNCREIADGEPYPSGLTGTVKVGDTVNINNGQVTPCLDTLRTKYRACSLARCSQEPADPACTVIVPIVSCGGAASSGTVTGFASICFTGFDAGTAPKWVDGSLECGEYASHSAGAGGRCLGTYASNPILIR